VDPAESLRPSEDDEAMADNQSDRYIVVGVTVRQPPAVLEEAAQFASHFRAVLVCAHVPEWDTSVFDADLADRIQEVVREQCVRVEFRELAGAVAHALGRLAEVMHADMIIVGSRRPGVRSSLREFLKGSVAAHLAHRQHRPVVVIPLYPTPAEDQLPWERPDNE
jgi:nucleotide-binding universal stress UspA family protein